MDRGGWERIKREEIVKEGKGEEERGSELKISERKGRKGIGGKKIVEEGKG